MKRKAKIHYTALDDFWRKEKKLEWIRENSLSSIAFESVTPDEKHNWINHTDNDWESLIPLRIKSSNENQGQVFINSSLGISTNRDEWIYDNQVSNLQSKIEYFINELNQCILRTDNFEDLEPKVKWSRDLRSKVGTLSKKLKFESKQIVKTSYRPFTSYFSYLDKFLIDRFTDQHNKFKGESLNSENIFINYTDTNSGKPFMVLASKLIADLHFVGAGAGTMILPLFTFDSENQKHENITDWALNQFQNHYSDRSEPSAVADGLTRPERKIKDQKSISTTIISDAGSKTNLQPPATAGGTDRTRNARISKEDIFYYVYAVLHAPAYRKKYEQNLKREFPRLPFYDDFFRWRDWGRRLMDLHLNYESVEPYPLERIEADLSFRKKDQAGDFFPELEETETEVFTVKPRTRLRADKSQSVIEIDTKTTLTGVPPLAWEYKLGNRSALEWILDQYKERKPKDATIAERFNAYKFEDYKEQVIDLLKRVCNVSVRTMEIVNQMPEV